MALRMIHDALTEPTFTINSVADNAGRQSAGYDIDGLTNAPVDILVSLVLDLQGAGTAPSLCYLYVAGSVDGGTTYSDNATGSDAAFTLANRLNSPLLAVIEMNGTTLVEVGPFSVAELFGGVLPQRIVFIFENQAGATMTASANTITMVGIRYEDA